MSLKGSTIRELCEQAGVDDTTVFDMHIKPNVATIFFYLRNSKGSFYLTNPSAYPPDGQIAQGSVTVPIAWTT